MTDTENQSGLDPTMVADIIANEMRVYYEENRETWWERNNPFDHRGKYPNGLSDNLMLGLMGVCLRARRELKK